MLTDKQRVLAVLSGQAVDRFPVAAPYLWLTQIDHWCELTGLPAWTFYVWRHQDPAEHVLAYADYLRQLPFDILQPQWSFSREQREAFEVVHRDGRHYGRDRRSGELTLLNEDLHQLFGGPNEVQRVFCPADADRLVEVTPAEALLEGGRFDYIIEASKRHPDKPIMTGVVGTFFLCTQLVGETRLFSMLYDAPELVEYLSARLLERNIEEIRGLAAAGSDVIYVDDALSTADLISVGFFERFCLPYAQAMVDEIQRLGKKVVVIYFGSVADRLAQIASLGADAVNVETSMKGYVNDLGEISRRIGERTCLWGNIDPLSVLQEGSDEGLRREIAAQVEIGRRTGRFIISTGSPITPRTPLARILRFIELGQELGQT